VLGKRHLAFSSLLSSEVERSQCRRGLSHTYNNNKVSYNIFRINLYTLPLWKKHSNHYLHMKEIDLNGQKNFIAIKYFKTSEGEYLSDYIRKGFCIFL
jgi:hypothetical protein